LRSSNKTFTAVIVPQLKRNTVLVCCLERAHQRDADAGSGVMAVVDTGDNLAILAPPVPSPAAPVAEADTLPYHRPSNKGKEKKVVQWRDEAGQGSLDEAHKLSILGMIVCTFTWEGSLQVAVLGHKRRCGRGEGNIAQAGILRRHCTADELAT